MSSEIYAKPDLSKKVRYIRDVQEDKIDWEEREVDIYESTDTIGDDHADIQSHKEGLHTEKHPPTVQRRTFRIAAYCFGVLCFLMITGIILSSILLTLGHHHLQSRYEELSSNYSWLHKLMSNLTFNYTKLQNSYQTLSRNQCKLQDEVKQLNDTIKGKWCPDGWRRFGCSCYFKSDEKESWEGSRDYCRQRGADLVVIDSKEEQFVTELSVDGESWIGLQHRGSGYKWEWVDTSPLTDIFWEQGLPENYDYRTAATCCNQQEQWRQNFYYNKKNWICEKKMFCGL
ncbi:CD209 antigen-like protein E isoform X2 [Plectropomus leopardus]|uniref:CD209 antigen-like protein E isoform X2 n=1 Tax=Plectropomus leopardus TaxID=160734 RepID=UPI001C4D4E70|nr:CD209 antigen-like protein E isoform X2 [Plectropomus leopardus]